MSGKADFLHSNMTDDISKFLYNPVPYMDKLFGREVHLFMHCHLKGYDRTGEGIYPDRTFFDKYGAPISLEQFWMEGYHSMDRMLAQHMFSLENDHIPFPPVAGYAGTTHLYKVGTDHGEAPWNWTGWVPRWKRDILWDPSDQKNKFINNRFFMSLRTNEIQNNAWDYHPIEDVEGPYEDLPEGELPERMGVGENTGGCDKFRGGYYFEGNSWGRYLHINNIKSCTRDKSITGSGPAGDFKRYSYVVHPLAYRDTIHSLPDNSCVDAIQWSILNINNELEDPHYNNPKEFYNPCLGLELFNDFPYSFSYNSELQTKPMDDPDFTIPCFNGERMHSKNDLNKDNIKDNDITEYNWWFNTYPLEYAEFLLVTSLTRGVWLHPLAANDLGFKHIDVCSDDIYEQNYEKRGTLSVDPKSKIVQSNASDSDRVAAMKTAKSDATGLNDGQSEHERQQLSAFLQGLPYGADTAFGYTTIIDPKLTMRKMAKSCYSTAADHEHFGMNQAEMNTIDCLIEGHHYSHTGVYGLFDYSHEDEGSETFPIKIEGQPSEHEPCYQMTEDMEMIFTFHPASDKKSSNFTYASADFVWKYELQLKTDNENEEITVHGYFNLAARRKTRLDLSTKYDKANMKWIRFLCFEPCSPQQRAWFIPVKGLAFGEPRHLLPRADVVENIEPLVPRMTNKIALVDEAENYRDVKILKESIKYFDKVFAVESKDLKFFFDDDEEVHDNLMYCYFMQVSPHQQNLDQLNKNMLETINSKKPEDQKITLEEVQEINDPIPPPRISQNVHGYFELASERGKATGLQSNCVGLSTRLDLCNSWDKETVASAKFRTGGEKEDVGPVVFFYAVDCKPEDKKVKAVEIQPKPRAIFAENTVADKVRNNTSEIVEIPDQNTWTGEPITGEEGEDDEDGGEGGEEEEG